MNSRESRVESREPEAVGNGRAGPWCKGIRSRTVCGRQRQVTSQFANGLTFTTGVTRRPRALLALDSRLSTLDVSLAPLLFLLLLTPTLAVGQRQQWRVQQQARSLATAMITSVLDIQLRQLRENKLTDLPLYDEIHQLRGRVDSLVSHEMQQVVGLLNPTDGAGEPQIQRARQLVRQIVVALLAERHRVRRRLQVSRTNALVRQLIEAQIDVLVKTRSLPGQPAVSRAALTLETLQDQRDTQAIFAQLVQALVDTSTWGGPLAADAADGLESLEQAAVESRLEQAIASLGRAQFRSAAEHQQSAIDGLRALLRGLDSSQGLGDSARDHVLQLVRNLIEQQQRVQRETRKSDLEQDQDRLGSQQREIERALSPLSEVLPPAGTFPILIAQARRASRAAELKLFEADKEAALKQQENVLGTLSRLQQQLQLAEPRDTKTAEQFALEQQALEQLDHDLGELMDLQAEATEQSASDPASAADKQRQVGEGLDNADQKSAVPESIQRSMDETQQAVAEAQFALQDPTSQAADSRQQATERAESALRELAAQVKAALGDMSPPQTSDKRPNGQPKPGDSSDSDTPGEAGPQSEREEQSSDSQSNEGAGQSTGTETTDSRAGNSATDTSGRARSLESEPWFAKLPPAVQRAMRAATRNRPPRGYEERLKRYFESVD